MASQTKSTPRRIPGAPPIIFLEGALPIDTPPNPSKHKTKTQEEKQITAKTSNYSYSSDDIPVFGRPFGMPVSAQRGESSAIGATMGTQEMAQRKRPKKSLNPYEEMLMEADSDLEKYLGVGGNPTASFMPSSSPSSTPTVTPDVKPVIPTSPLSVTKPSFRTKLSGYFRRPGSSRAQQEELDPLDDEISPPLFVTTAPPPTECSICTEEFTPRLKPPAWITLTCLHQPSVCTPCLSLSIRADLENKIWSNIRCPEQGCDAVLIYEDVKRLADAITFARYEILSFRSAVSTDPNFVWCQKCNFGQLHSDGAHSPIVNCLNCNNRTCFTHQVPWHTGMTCAEYDLLVADPDNFGPAESEEKSAAALLLEEQEEAAATKEREEVHKERLAEQERQRTQHAETRRLARESQKEEARKKRVAWEQGELKRRLKEEKASLAKVEGTTKKCPGCKWPIEKNSGCAHMTCTQCRHEFCWKCLRLWAGHGTAC